MKVIAQGDPVEYDVSYPGDACRLYRQEMTWALIGVVTVNTDHERAKAADGRVAELEATLRQIRRWIEAEDRPGEWTSEIYTAAGKALPY